MKFLGPDLVNNNGISAFGGGGGGSIQNARAVLAAAVTLSTSVTWFSGPSVSLPAGTWLIIGQAQYLRNGTGGATVTARLWAGAELASQTLAHPSATAFYLGFHLCATVVLASTTSVEVQMLTNVGGAASFMNHQAFSAAGNNATSITAIRLA